VAGFSEKVSMRYLNVPLTALPAPQVEAEGFMALSHPILLSFQLQPLLGVYEDWLVIGTSPTGINKCLASAAGKTPNITTNERFRKEGLMPPAGACSASFADLSNVGQELAGACFGLGMVSGFMPNEPETRVVKTMFSLLRLLVPALNEIDFYSSSSTTCTFDGTAWKMEAVVNLKPEALNKSE